MTFPNGYQITERTRLKVRYIVYGSNSIDDMGEVNWLRGFRNLEDCQRAYIERREESHLGASRFGTGEVFDESGQHIANLSYNGRAWPPCPWRPHLEPLAEAPCRFPAG